MTESTWLAERFEEHRPHLRAVAYRMLGSLTEADDAVQETWLRVSWAGAGGVENLGGWLTTIVARVCLNMLRARRVRREDSLDDSVRHLPDPVISPVGKLQPEEEALLADAVGLAERTEHAVGHRPQVGSVLLEALGQPRALVHRSHPSVVRCH